MMCSHFSFLTSTRRRDQFLSKVGGARSYINMLQTDNGRLGVGLLKMGRCPKFHFGKRQNIMMADEGTIEARSAH